MPRLALDGAVRLGAEVGPLEGPLLVLAPVERDGPLLGPLGPAGPLLLVPPERDGVVRAGTPGAVR